MLLSLFFNYKINMEKKLIRLTESDLHRIIKESVNRVLKESIKGVDSNNVVPENIAVKYGFKPQYNDPNTGLEIWGKRIEKGMEKKYLRALGISNFISYDRSGNVSISVKTEPKPQQQYDYM
jgi:hypothetical protein